MYLCAQIPKAQKDTYDLTVFLSFWDLQTKKLLEMVKSTPDVNFTKKFTDSL